MNAKDFKSRWAVIVKRERAKAAKAGVPEVADDLKLVRARATLLDTPLFPSDAAQFLITAGLPGSCAPFLSFEAISEGPLPLARYYGAQNFDATESTRLASFFVLGSDGSGNPLCLDSARQGEIVMLDHEDRFKTRTFVASSVAQLAEALLILHTVPHENFVEHLRPCDPPAAEESAFLPAEVAMLIE